MRACAWWIPALRALPAVLALAACAAPDRREVDWERELAEVETQDGAQVQVPAQWTPIPEQASPFLAPADGGPVDLSIEQVVMLAMANNRDLQVQQLNPVIAGTFEEIERGVFVALFLTGSTFNLQSFIGCIMLGGIVVNNAILLVDQAGRLLEDGHDARAAVAEAGRRRLRPILMTTLTTVLALLPLALGVGEGADAQAPLARTVVGGLTASTLITLVLIPAVFVVFHRGRASAG